MENQNNIGATTNNINVELKELTRKNLLRVLDELPKLMEKMPKIKEYFYMGIFGVYNNLKRENLRECKTFGCLLGNSARIFKDEFTNDLFNEDDEFDYRLFGKKYFPYLYNEFSEVTLKWEYLFDNEWEYSKFGKFEDGLQRIKYLLANDLACHEFSFETNKIIK